MPPRRSGFDVSRADDLETAMHDLAGAGVMEVLVEAGPQLTDHVLQSPFWDEHNDHLPERWR